MTESRPTATPLKKEKRSKRQHNKTRTGCITCRRRHLKCDEGKPGCNRCVEGRRRCEGYDTPVPWIFDPQPAKATVVYQPASNLWTGRTPASKNGSTNQSWMQPIDHRRSRYRPAFSMYPLAHPLSMHADWSERERHKLWLYLQLSRSTLEAADAADVELFCTFLPQVSLHVLPLRFAILCFASYIGSLIDPSNANDCQLAAEWQYRQVLKSAAYGQSPSSSSNWVELFLVSLLLRCLETYRNDYDRASTHLSGAIGIVKANELTSTTQPLDPCVQHIINRLKVKVDSRSKILCHSPMSGFDKFNTVIGDICKVFDVAAETGLGNCDRSQLVKSCVSQLNSYFPKVEIGDIQVSQSPSSIYLQIQCEICRLVLRNLEDLSVLSEPESYTSLQNILDLCIKFSESSLRGVTTISTQGQRIRLGFGIEIISDILFIATVCGDRKTRQLAVSLLRSCYRQEWLWDSFQAAQIAEWLMHQEDDNVESGAAESSSSRPVISSAGFYQERRASGCSFRRPSWARLSLVWSDRETQHWLLLDRPSHRAQPQTQTSHPDEPVLCYNLQGPFWSSTALALTKAYTRLLDDTHIP